MNWMRRKLQPSVCAERLDQRGLGDARVALDQDVAAREQRDEQRLGDRRRADEGLADLVGDRAGELADAGEVSRAIPGWAIEAGSRSCVRRAVRLGAESYDTARPRRRVAARRIRAARGGPRSTARRPARGSAARAAGGSTRASATPASAPCAADARRRARARARVERLARAGELGEGGAALIAQDAREHEVRVGARVGGGDERVRLVAARSGRSNAQPARRRSAGRGARGSATIASSEQRDRERAPPSTFIAAGVSSQSCARSSQRLTPATERPISPASGVVDERRADRRTSARRRAAARPGARGRRGRASAACCSRAARCRGTAASG